MSDQEQAAGPDLKSPKAGELTGNQTKGDGIGSVGFNALPMRGYDPAPPGTFQTYDRMRRNPTIVLARAVSTMPIKTAEVSYESHDDVPDDVVQFVQDVMEPLWPVLLRDILLALDFGFSAFEKVWEAREINGTKKLVYRKLKPLRPSLTEIRVADDGSFAGFKQEKVELPPEKCFIFSNDQEYGNLHGFSRNENVRNPWSQWEQLCSREGQYLTKVSAIIPQVEYPEGKSKDKNGTERDNFELAQLVVNEMCRGNGVTMPNVLARYAQDLVKSGVDVTKLKAWMISFLETKGSHGDEIGNRMRHKESLMLRGWLVPERAASEGQQGTKAEAETHGDLAVSVAQLVLDDILRDVNAYVIDPLLIYNFGQARKGSVYLSAGGLSPDQAAFIRTVVSGILTQPGNTDLFLRLIDYDALIDQVGLPKASEVVDVNADDVAPERPKDEVSQDIQTQAASIIQSIRQRRSRS